MFSFNILLINSHIISGSKIFVNFREHSVRTLGLCCIHSASRLYPPEDGAHIAISKSTNLFFRRFYMISEELVRSI